MPSDDLRLVFQLTQRDDLMEVRLTAPGGECRTETEPAAIFTARAIRPGPAALAFSVWQDGGQIASVAHPVRALEAGRQPGAGISAPIACRPRTTTCATLGLALAAQCEQRGGEAATRRGAFVSLLVGALLAIAILSRVL